MTLVWFLVSVAAGYLLQPYAVKVCRPMKSETRKLEMEAKYRRALECERGKPKNHPVANAIAAGMEATYRNAQHIPLMTPNEHREARSVAIHRWGEAEPIRRDLVAERRHPMTGDVIQTWQETRREIRGDWGSY